VLRFETFGFKSCVLNPCSFDIFVTDFGVIWWTTDFIRVNLVFFAVEKREEGLNWTDTGVCRREYREEDIILWKWRSLLLETRALTFYILVFA